MKKTIQFIAVATLCLFLTSPALAQTAALKIGDKVPDLTVNNIINYKTTRVKLSDFRGKLLILDFWATWCSACLKNFPMLDSLQRKYPDQLQVMLVNDVNTGDTPETIKVVFERKVQANGHPYVLPSIVNDEQLTQLFPHKLLPHYVWIGADGLVKAITSSADLTPANIERMINEQPAELTLKKDYDISKLLFLSENTPGSIIQYAVFLKGRVEGLSSGNIYRRDGSVLYGRSLTNSTLYDMYHTMAMALLKNYSKKMVLTEVSDANQFVPTTTNIKDPAWLKQNLYTLEVVVPVSQSGKLYPFMLEQLNAFSGYEAALETRMVKCLVLKTTPGKLPVPTAGDKPAVISFDGGAFKMSNRSLSSLVSSLNNVQDLPLPVVDESGFKPNTDISLSGSVRLGDLQKELRAQGLELNEAERAVTFFVIREKSNKSYFEAHKN